MKNLNVAVTKKSETIQAQPVTSAPPQLTVVSKDPLFRLVSEWNRDDLIKAGAGEIDLDRPVERMIDINMNSGELVFGDRIKGKTHSTTVEGRILRTALLISDALDHKILIVMTHNRTYFNMMPGQKRYGFYVPAVSGDVKDAVLNLFSNNLARGQEIFEKTANRLKPDALLFWELLQAAFPAGGTVEFELGMGDRNVTETVMAKLFFVPGDLAKTIMKIGGYNYDFDFLNYPAYYMDAFKRARVAASKVTHKLTGLAMERAAILKPKQQRRKEKEAATLANAAALLETAVLHAPGTLPATVPQPESTKPAKLSKTAQMKTSAKKTEKPKEGKEKKKEKKAK